MLKFTECKISLDSLRLAIRVKVEDLPYYKDVYIDKIVVDDMNTYATSGPSTKPLYTKTFDGNQKEVGITLTAADLGGKAIAKDMFFVWAIAKGTPSPDTPCGFDTAYLLCIAFDEAVIYSNGLYCINDLTRNRCNVPQNFITWMLDCEALRLCLKTGEYADAVTLWKRIVDGPQVTSSSSNCGCNG